MQFAIRQGSSPWLTLHRNISEALLELNVEYVEYNGTKRCIKIFANKVNNNDDKNSVAHSALASAY